MKKQPPYRLKRLKEIRGRLETRANAMKGSNQWAHAYARDVEWLLKDIDQLTAKLKTLLLLGTTESLEEKKLLDQL